MTPESKSFRAKVLNISTVIDVEDESSALVANIDGPEGWMQLPVEKGHGLQPGDSVTITEIVDEHPSGGSLTTYKITKDVSSPTL